LATSDREIVVSRVFDALRELVFPSAADCDTVEMEYGAIEGGKQTLERLAGHLLKMNTERITS
jgi:hypothetical protein